MSMAQLKAQTFNLVLEAVREAGKLLFDREGSQHIENKSPTDFVTDVDFAVQRRLEKVLRELTPEIAFVGEEHAGAIDLERDLWLLDPVDGTTNLIHDMQQSAISLAYISEGRVMAGIVYNPFSGECYTAKRGEGAYLNGQPIAVRTTEHLKDALMGVGTNSGRRDFADDMFRWIRAMYDHCRDIRRLGSAALDLCYVAAGRYDGFAELILMPWDYAAGLLIVEEAGGRVTNFNGAPVSLDRESSIVASNTKLHEEILNYL